MLQLAADNPMEGHRPNTGASKAKWGLGAGSDGNGLAKSLQVNRFTIPFPNKIGFLHGV